jgi:hypothetical protein
LDALTGLSVPLRRHDHYTKSRIDALKAAVGAEGNTCHSSYHHLLLNWQLLLFEKEEMEGLQTIDYFLEETFTVLRE